MRRPQRYWRSVFAGLADSDAVYETIRARYSDARRSYHTIGHVLACLDLLAAYTRWNGEIDGESRFLLEAALWFHDAVYEPGAADNEERSAELAFRSSRRMGVSTSNARSIGELVLATAHFEESPSAVSGALAALVQDVDLAVLGATPAEFRRYEWAVRREYDHRTDYEYRLGRRRVCGHFLSRERIFVDEWFRGQFEARARANLAWCLRHLDGQEEGTSA